MNAAIQTKGVSSKCGLRKTACTPVAAFKPVSFRTTQKSVTQPSRNNVVVAAGSKVVAIAQIIEENAEELKLPAGYHWYETMLIMQPTMSDDARDKELAKFEAFLNKEECTNIYSLIKGRSRLAYSIKNANEGTYVLYNYAAKRQTAKSVQLLLSKPEAGSENNILRHITFCKS